MKMHDDTLKLPLVRSTRINMIELEPQTLKNHNMKNFAGLTLSISVFLLLSTATWADTPASENIPPAIAAPANQKLQLTLHARGDQIYECRTIAGATGKFEWVNKEPDADLFDELGHNIGHHSVGPKWELSDDNKITGHLRSKVQSPDGKGIPWLLLDVEQASGPLFRNVVSIQRVDTVDGQAPDEPADATKLGQTRRIKYSATYKFYAQKQ
jgi:hypothetical protein